MSSKSYLKILELQTKLAWEECYLLAKRALEKTKDNNQDYFKSLKLLEESKEIFNAKYKHNEEFNG